MLKSFQLCVVLSVLWAGSAFPYGTTTDFYGQFIPDIDQTVGSGAVGTGQQGTVVNIAPNISNLFPEIGASGIPASVNLSEYEITMTGGTWDDLLAEWGRRERLQANPLQTTPLTLQPVGFPWTQTGLYGQATGSGLDLFLGAAQGGVGASGQATGAGIGTFGASGYYPTTTSTAGSVFPWMNSYWTATSAGTELQTLADPQFPSLGAADGSLLGSGVGWY